MFGFHRIEWACVLTAPAIVAAAGCQRMHNDRGSSNAMGVARSAEPVAKEKQLQIITLVEEIVQPEAWEHNGGDLATIEHRNRVFHFEALKQTPEAQAVVDEGRAFLVYLHSAIPSTRKIGGLDAQPSGPFDRSDTVVIYDVRDFITAARPGDDPVESLIDIIVDSVDPEGWRMNGGDASNLQYLDGYLIIENTVENQARIRDLLAELR